MICFIGGGKLNKNLYCKVFAVGIILLFVGVSFSSAISVDKHSIIENQEECKECNEVDDKHIQFLERQLNRLEVYSKWLLVLSKYFPELKEISNDFKSSTSFKESFAGRPLCDILFSLILTLNATLMMLFSLQEKLWHLNIIYQIVESILGVVMLTFNAVWVMGDLLVCDWSNS